MPLESNLYAPLQVPSHELQSDGNAVAEGDAKHEDAGHDCEADEQLEGVSAARGGLCVSITFGQVDWP